MRIGWIERAWRFMLLYILRSKTFEFLFFSIIISNRIFLDAKQQLNCDRECTRSEESETERKKKCKTEIEPHYRCVSNEK